MSIIRESNYQYTRVGETTWYVDEEGIISLKVGDKIYGEGKIVNRIKINASVIESEEDIKNKAKVRIEIYFENEVETIKFGGSNIEVPEKSGDKYVTEVEVTENGVYEIEVKGTNGAQEKEEVEVNQIEELNNQINIKPKVTFVDEFMRTKANIELEIGYVGEVEKIKIKEEEIAVPTKKDGKYIVNKEVTENGKYLVEVTAKDGTTNKVVIQVNIIEKLNENIKIKSTVTTSSDYTKATIGLEITYSNTVTSIKIDDENITVPTKKNGKYVVSKEVLKNGEYKVEVKSKDGTTNKVIVKVSDITEDMEIWNRADMESFRDKVNSGRTFEGRTVTVMSDFNLGGSSNNWVPIGDTNLNSDYTIKENNVFKGTFEGNKHIISNLYINSNAYVCSGLFATSKGTIKDTILKNVNITNTKEASTTSLKTIYTGGIVAVSDGNITNCGLESGVINSVGTVASYGTDYYCRYVGGCAAITYIGNSNEVSGCYNKATLSANVPMIRYNSAYVGGVVGVNQMPVKNCYNTGTLNGSGGHAIVGGVVGEASYATSTVSNIYNVGSVTGSGVSNTEQWIGGAIGKIYEISYSKWYTLDTSGYSYWYLSNGWKVSYTGIVNSSTLKSYASQLGSAFKSDKNPNINSGYPILSWQ